MADDARLAAMSRQLRHSTNPASSYEGGAGSGPLASSFSDAGPAPRPTRKDMTLPQRILAVMAEARRAGPAPTASMQDEATRLLQDGPPTFAELSAATRAAMVEHAMYRPAEVGGSTPGVAFSQAFAPSSRAVAAPAPVNAWLSTLTAPAAGAAQQDPLGSALGSYAAMVAQQNPADAPRLANLWTTISGLHQQQVGAATPAAGDDDDSSQ
jgi:hypothetical protein